MLAAALGTMRGREVLVAGLFSDTASQRRSAEDLLRVLKGRGVAAQPFDLTATFGRRATIAVPDAYLMQELAEITVDDIIIVAPPTLTSMAVGLLRGPVLGAPRMIAFWDRELGGQQAAMQQAASRLDAIWTPTARLADIVLASLPDFAGEIDIVNPRTIAATATVEDRAAIRARLGVAPAAFVVGVELAIGGRLAGQNPAGTINAFRSAFDDDHDAWLVVRCELPDADAPEYSAVMQAAKHPRIRVFDTLRHFLPPASLLRAADVWLSLPCDEADRSTVDDALGACLPVVTCACGLTPAQWSHPAVHPVRFTRPTDEDAKPEWVAPETAHAAGLLRGLREVHRRAVGCSLD
jgi:hypothetical protein